MDTQGVIYMTRTISLAEAQASYATVIDQVRTTGEPFVIEQDAEPCLVVLPFADYRRLTALRQIPRKKVWQEEQHSVLRREQAAFERMKPELQRTCKGKWVAVLNGQLVDSDADDKALVKRVYAQYGYRTMLITQVQDAPRVWEFSSPEVGR